MAAFYRLAPNTVASAYRTLGERGVVTGRGRHGTFISDIAGAPRSDPLIPDGLIDLASGNPDPELLPDLAPHMASLEPTRVLYGIAPLDAAFRSTVSDVLRSGGVRVDSLMAVNGALDGIERALIAHARVGDQVAMEAPGWRSMASLVSALGMRPVPVEIDRYGMRPDRLSAVIGSVRSVILTPRCQNPTGAFIDASRAAELGDVLERAHDVLVIEDDHGGLISGVDLSPVAQGRPRWVHIHSFGKPLGPDLRIAAVTGDEETIGRMAGRQRVGPGWVSHIAQRLVASLLGDRSVVAELTHAAEEYARRRRLLIDSTSPLGLEPVGATGLNVWVPVREEGATVAALAGAGYAVRPGELYRMGTGPAIRFSVGALTDDMVPEIVGVLEGLVEARSVVAR
jgi:DNA-binding transcriptional MocR family regulator